MSTWADDPELVETFRAELSERLASLSSGLLAMETHRDPKQLVTELFRDAHTVKGSARMMGLEPVVQVAHQAEDVLAAIRDGRVSPDRPVVDALLAACDAMGRQLDGAPVPADEAIAALRSALAVPESAPPAAPPAPRPTDSVRVGAGKVYGLLDAVGEAELDGRRIQRAGELLAADVEEHGRAVREVAVALAEAPVPGSVQAAVRRLLGTADALTASASSVREATDTGAARLGEVREGAMQLAMVPVRQIVAGLPRLVRDVAGRGGKDVRLVVVGEEVEADKQVLEGVADVLKHLVINAVDHGCERPDVRAAAGKPPVATVTVSARSGGGTLVLEVSDDGAGISEATIHAAAVRRGLIAADAAVTGPDLLAFLFAPEFSTTESVTETSGRGVGLDVVRNTVEAMGGAVDLRSEPGIGTVFTLALPLTLGVLRCLIAQSGTERFALPLPSVVECISLRNRPVHSVAGAMVVERHGGTLPLLDLGAVLGVQDKRAPTVAVIARHGERQLAWAVDRLDGERELVVKDLGPFLGRVPLVSAATIASDGRVVCVVDMRELGDRATGAALSAPVPAPVPTVAEPAIGPDMPRVLVVDDSVGVRELERVILEGAGFAVDTAPDGTAGAARLRGAPVDVVVADVEMPGLNGFELTREIRRTRGWEHVPVIIMTSRGSEEDKREGLEAGASAYLLKTEFDQAELVETVRRLAGR